VSSLIGCGSDSGIRSYEEDISAPKGSLQVTGEKPGPQSGKLEWNTPEGWKESRETGLRLVSFMIEPGNKRGLCTVVALKDDGGGLKANVQRWMAQLKLPADSMDDLDGFLSMQKSFETQGGFAARLVDFTSLIDSLDSRSMLVSVITLPGQTLFVKIVEKKGFLLTMRKEFLTFSKSFKFGSSQDKNQ
jgi:hypothetical protein